MVPTAGQGVVRGGARTTTLTSQKGFMDIFTFASSMPVCKHQHGDGAPAREACDRAKGLRGTTQGLHG